MDEIEREQENETKQMKKEKEEITENMRNAGNILHISGLVSD